MMRRIRRGFSGRKNREPTSWDRTELSTFNASAFGTPFGVTVFDPTTVITGAQDLRLTVRKMLLEVFPTWTFSAAVAQFLVVGLGGYLSATDEAIRDPLLTAPADQRTDWLWLTHDVVFINAGASVLGLDSAARGIRGSAFSFNCPSVRAMRKVDQDQVIRVAANLKRLDSATFAAPTQTRSGLVVDASILYSRTMRR